MIPALVWKIAPWAGLALAITIAVQMYGARKQAEGKVKAYVETADAEHRRYAADSISAAKARAVAADSIARLNRTITQAEVQQRVAARRADSAAADLRETLDSAQRAKLDVVTANHAREREAWGQKEAAYLARLQLMAADSARMEGQLAGLQRENDALRKATVEASPGHGASFVQRVSPYIAAGLALAYGVDKVMHR